MYSLRKLGTALHKWSYASIRAFGGPSSIWRLVEERGRYTCHVIVFARGKSKNAAMPDEERCSALSRFLHPGKRNNTRQCRTASIGEFTACSGNPHPLLVPSRLLHNSGNNRAGQPVLVPVGGSVQLRHGAHAPAPGCRTLTSSLLPSALHSGISA
jgi:hypothetical protein